MQLVIAIDCSMMIRVITVWLLISMYAYFLGNLEIMAVEQGKKIKYRTFCTKLNVFRKYEGKTRSLPTKL